MDGKGRDLDNMYIERFWKSLKYEKIYLNPSNGELDLYQKGKELLNFIAPKENIRPLQKLS